MTNLLKALIVAAALLGFAWLAHFSLHYDRTGTDTSPQARREMNALYSRLLGKPKPMTKREQAAAIVYLFGENGEAP